MAMHRNSQNAFGRILADDVFVEASDDFAWTGDFGEELLARTASLALLVEDRLTEFNALATDVDIAGAFDERADVAIALTTERAKRILFGGSAATAAEFFARGHSSFLPKCAKAWGHHRPYGYLR